MIKEIPGFPGYYADTDGNVWSTHTGDLKKLKPTARGGGYLAVNLCKDLKVSTKKIARLILETFEGPCPEGLESCHNDGNKNNNKLSNLRWDTGSNNCLDKVKHGTMPDINGEKNPMVKLNNEIVKDIKCLLEKTNMTHEAIGKIFDVGRACITKINLGLRWRHI